MTLSPDDSDFDGLDPETKFRIESLVAKPVGKLDAGNPQVWFWFDGRGRELSLDSTSGPSFTGAPVMISRIILLAVIAIISVAAYFCGFRLPEAILRQAVRFVLTKDRVGASVAPQRNVGGGSDKLRSRPIAHAERFQPLAGTPSRGDADANPGCSS